MHTSSLHMTTRPQLPTRFPYTTLFRSHQEGQEEAPPVRADHLRRHGGGAVRGPVAVPKVGFPGHRGQRLRQRRRQRGRQDRKSTRLNSSHLGISYAVFCLKKKSKKATQ